MSSKVGTAPSRFNERFILFADGASSGNPGPGGWGTIAVDLREGRVLELGGREAGTTNNRMEIQGAIAGLEAIQGLEGEVALYTDSVYLIRGITQWIWGWRSRGWKTAEGKDVANPDLWKKLSMLVADRKSLGPIHWRWVKGHSGIPGNERVDEIATHGSHKKWIDLYDGPLVGYPIALFDLPEDTSLPERETREERKPKAAAHSYLSLVNGVCMRHQTWKSCEARVKGRPGARFKKAESGDHERLILSDWRVHPDSVRNDSDVPKAAD